MRLRKSNQGRVVKSITAKLVKIASMDVYVQDFQYPERLDTIGDLASHALYKLPYDKLSEPEKQEFQKHRVGETVAGDGDDYFESKGTINFYTAGLRPERVKEWTDIILNDLKANGAEKIGPVKQEKSGVYNSNVIRIPIGNIVKKEVVRPPELNMANANAVHIFQTVLGYTFGEGHLDNINAKELISRIDYYLGEKQLPESPMRGQVQQLMPFQEGADDEYQKVDSLFGPMKEFNPELQEKPSLTVYHGGYDETQIRDRLQQIKNIAQWALKNGYDKLAVY